MAFTVYPRALVLFYRSVLPFTGLCSGIVVGADGVGARLLLLKLSTFPLVAYLVARMRPHHYWLYRNLHLAPWQLWAFVVLLDTGLFGGAVLGLHWMLA